MLNKYSFGVGDRFGQEGEAQLRAVARAGKESECAIAPVWNKSHREHEIIETNPGDVRDEADQAVNALNWNKSYFVDADHITRDIVDPYISCSDFFTIDVAEYIGTKAEQAEKDQFLKDNQSYIGALQIPGIKQSFNISDNFLADWADQYLLALSKAEELINYIRSKKESDAVFEISMDEVDTPQTPVELFFILKETGRRNLPLNTIAPKFTGNFYKGIDYRGDIEKFAAEFEQDILVIKHAVSEFGLPSNLKLSVHSGSDKFSLYPHINRLIKKYDAGIHLKTSGTTWLEELIGLSQSGKKGERWIKEIYQQAYQRYEELIKPYAPVVDINRQNLPAPEEFDQWNNNQIANALEHKSHSKKLNADLRQFLHCSYKIAAEHKGDFINLLTENADIVGKRVTDNLYKKHIKPIFCGNSTGETE